MGVTSPTSSEPLMRNDAAMRYRPMGSTGLMVSALSMGCMRLTEDQAKNDKLITTALDLGINYFETARTYCRGQCQHRTAPGIKGRENGIIVSGKTHVQADTTAHSFLKEIERSLEILGLTHIKFFQIASFKWANFKYLLRPDGALDAVRQAKQTGMIQHFGFTGHDTPELYNRLLETGLFDCITVPYNILYRGYEPTIKLAGQLGVAVVAMCPIGGGSLAYDAGSHPLQKTLKLDMPTAELALKFALSNPDVSTVCSGMTEVEFIRQNARLVREFDPDQHNLHDIICEGIDRLRQTVGDKICTNCGYCLPCLQGVNIPHHMDLYRNWQVFGLDASSENWPGSWVRNAINFVPAEQNATRCNQCGQCEEKCPHELPIRDTLTRLAEHIVK